MAYIEGLDRNQTQLLPPTIEEYVGEEAAVRFIDAWVESLSLVELGFEEEVGAKTGRPGYNPGCLVRLYLYGYLNRIRSSRRLEVEAQRNLELIWLLRGLRPDFKTIADFRKDHLASFKKLFREFNLLCRELGMFGAELVAIDGSKFKAVNSPAKHYTLEKLDALEQHVTQKVDEYLEALKTSDEQAEGSGGAQPGLAKKIEQMRERQEKYRQIRKEMETQGKREVALTDPDSRGQKDVRVGYNVQVSVDSKHHLIAAQDVVQDANDLAQLGPMALQTKKELNVETLTVTADAGYHQADQLEQCEDAGIETYVSQSEGTTGKTKEGREVYPKTAFTYEAQEDTYRCPGNQVLSFGYATEERAITRRYYYNVAACGNCQLRSLCTTARYRKISRRTNEAVIERQLQRVRQRPEVTQTRKTIVEHVFGTLRMWGHDVFVCRGLEKVRAEFSLSALAYNLRRVLNICSWKDLIEACAR